MSKKVLLVSIAFPPKSDPESLQVGRYVKYLSRLDCEIEVITSANPTLYMETDKKLEQLARGVKSIYELRLIENRYANFIIRKLNPALLQYPDPKFSFHLKTPSVKKPDVLYSRSYPLSSTILALKLKKKWPDVPWMLHLSDPWAAAYEGDSPATNFKKSSRKWNEKKEIECFKLAEKISFTSEKTIELYSERYPEYTHKFLLTRNVYDDESVNPNPVTFDQRLNVVYTGGFGEKRDPVFYLNTIKTLLAQNPQLSSKINFLFSGPMTKSNQAKFDQFKGIKEIKHLGLITYDKMIDLQRQAHVLVNIDTDIKDPRHSVFFPSKLLEYFAAKRRILAITNEHSVTSEVVSGKFGDCVEFGNNDRLMALFKEYLRKFEEKDAGFFELDQDIEQYSAGSNASKLNAEINNLIAAGAR